MVGGRQGYRLLFEGERVLEKSSRLKRKLKKRGLMSQRLGTFEWEMVVVIPSSIFIHNEGLRFSKLISNANFYKCGDDTSKRHYLSWNPVKTPNPDFHRPEYFGTLNFK